MRCQECGDRAAYAPSHRHIRVGLCEEHITAYMAALEHAVALRRLAPGETERGEAA